MTMAICHAEILVELAAFFFGFDVLVDDAAGASVEMDEEEDEEEEDGMVLTVLVLEEEDVPEDEDNEEEEDDEREDEEAGLEGALGGYKPVLEVAGMLVAISPIVGRSV
ncbi:hypothetical protein ABW21_db0209641 [Orbilia brochopaga]|nr:hypothetical protein ABW21_db0209641 [Drechslerella brochopaga]